MRTSQTSVISKGAQKEESAEGLEEKDVVVGVLVWRWGRREILLQSSRQQGTADQQHRLIQESFTFIA